MASREKCMAAIIPRMRRYFISTVTSRTFAGKLRNMRSVTAGGGGRRRSRGGLDKEEESRPAAASACWVPDPRTGIYFPRGQEWVMEDVPENAARLGHISCWLRNVDGVEKPDPDHAQDNLSGT